MAIKHTNTHTHPPWISFLGRLLIVPLLVCLLHAQCTLIEQHLMTGNKHNHKPHIHRKARNSSCCYMIICVEIKSPIAINACNICSYQKTIRNDAPVKSLAYQKFVHIQSIAYECVNVRLCVCVCVSNTSSGLYSACNHNMEEDKSKSLS